MQSLLQSQARVVGMNSLEFTLCIAYADAHVCHILSGKRRHLMCLAVVGSQIEGNWAPVAGQRKMMESFDRGKVAGAPGHFTNIVVDTDCI